MFSAMTAAIFQQSIDKHVDLSNGMLKHNFKLGGSILRKPLWKCDFFFHEFLRVLQHN